MTPAQILNVHQLLGRLGYFHALFIEPTLAAHPEYVTDLRTRVANADFLPTVAPHHEHRMALDLRATAWNVLPAMITRLPLDVTVSEADEDCVTCRVIVDARMLSAAWIAVQARALDLPVPAPATDLTVGILLGRAFAMQHDADCALIANLAPPGTLPGVEALPLTAELLACWHDPFNPRPEAVSRWLNHCSGLDDIRHIIRTRSAA